MHNFRFFFLTNRTSADASSLLPRRLFRVAASLILAAGLSFAGPAAVPSASAQNSSAAHAQTGSAHWQAHFDEQVAHALRQHPSMRTTYIQTVLRVADDHKRLDLSRTVGALLDIIEEDSSREHRLIAIQALHAIGAEHAGEERYRQALDRLYALMQEESSERVRDAAAETLTQYTKSG